jgi:UrcA family protein
MAAAAVALVSAGATLAATNASPNQGATMQPITVQAHHGVQKKQVGLSYTGIPIEQVSLSREVGYGDLDLSTPEGKAKLEKRIKTVAREACGQLHKLYPLDTWDTDNRTCIADAVDRAMNQEKAIVAGAPQAH